MRARTLALAAAVGAFGVVFLAVVPGVWFLGFGGAAALVAGTSLGGVVAAGTYVVLRALDGARTASSAE